MSGKSRTARRNRPAGPGGQHSATPAADRKAGLPARKQAQHLARRRRWIITWGGIAAVTAAIVTVLYVIFSGGSSTAGAGKYPYQAGSPGAGQAAPGFTLAASSGGNISLSQFRGKTVLLFFQEGLTCQPCWDQITDLQQHAAQLRAAGIGTVVSITSDPVGAITTKAGDMGLTIPVLSDPNLAISQQYDANSYGMMGASRDGHTFIVVGPDGTIRWRADYGGAPKYTMFLPTTSVLADLNAGEHPS